VSNQPQIKSTRQHIRLWFEWYRICFRDPSLKGNLRKSKKFYESWGDVSSIKFDDWWKTHKDLFGETRVEEISKVSNKSNVLNLSIPLNQPVSKVIGEVRELVTDKQTERLKELGLLDKRSKSKVPTYGLYELTKGVEIRGRTHYEIQLMYQIWLDMEKPPINTEFCSEVVHRLKNRPRSNWTPYLLQQEPSPDRKGNLRYDENQLRQVRRYIKKGEKICQSVSLGEFPGRTRL
jgi:hypothetical protein